MSRRRETSVRCRSERRGSPTAGLGGARGSFQPPSADPQDRLPRIRAAVQRPRNRTVRTHETHACIGRSWPADRSRFVRPVRSIGSRRPNSAFVRVALRHERLRCESRSARIGLPGRKTTAYVRVLRRSPLNRVAVWQHIFNHPNQRTERASWPSSVPPGPSWHSLSSIASASGRSRPSLRPRSGSNGASPPMARWCPRSTIGRSTKSSASRARAPARAARARPGSCSALPKSSLGWRGSSTEAACGSSRGPSPPRDCRHGSRKASRRAMSDSGCWIPSRTTLIDSAGSRVVRSRSSRRSGADARARRWLDDS